MSSTALSSRALAGLALAAGLFFYAPAAHAQLIGTFGVPYRPFNGQVTFTTGVKTTPSLSVNMKAHIDNGWAAARPRVAQLVKNELGKARRFRGQTAYQINVALAARGELQAMADGPRLAIKYTLRGNSVTAKMTTPTIFGSYADPKFSVDFDVEMIFHIGRLANGKIGVTSATASLHNAKLRGRNVTGTVGLAIADAVKFFGGPNLRALAQNAINAQSVSRNLNVALAPVAFPGSLFSSMSGPAVTVRLVNNNAPGPVIR